MKRLIGRFPRIALAASALALLGGCVYGPGYYARPGVVYDDGTVASVPAYANGYADSGYYAAGPAYYGPAYYGPGYGYYDPWWPVGVGLGFYGGYYYGGHYWHGGHGGSWHGGHGSSHGGGSHHTH